MAILKLLWTNKRVTVTSSNQDKLVSFDINDVVFHSADKNYIFNLISDAVTSLDYSGFHAHVFYEGENIYHENLKSSSELKKKKDIMEFIKYKITSNFISASFDNYMYSYTLTKESDDGRFIIADFFNIDFVQCLIYSFDKLGISLDLLSSFNPVLSGIAKSIDDDKPFILNYITELGSTDFVFYCNDKSGIPSFVRYTPPYNNRNEVEESIERSFTYGKQLFSGSTPKMYVIKNSLNDIPYNLNDDKMTSLEDDGLVYSVVNGMSGNMTSNVIPQSERGKKQQKKRIGIVTAVIFLIFILSFCFYFMTGHFLLLKKSESSKYKDYQINLEDKLNKLHSIGFQKHKNNYILSPYSNYSFKLLNEISKIIPDDITLVNFSSKRIKNGDIYSVEYKISGFVYSNPLEAVALLKQLEKKMKENPFYATIKESWRSNWLLNIEKWKKSGAKSLSGSKNKGITFNISGVIYE